MPTYGIIGFPLTHSFSKQYFDEKFAAEHLGDARFESFPLRSISEFPAIIDKHPTLRGLSVTIPYKEQVLRFVTSLSPEVQEIGAANCIRIDENGLTAFNTDIIGFERSFTRSLRNDQRQALVLGSGGASKAVQYVLTRLGIGFLIVSREKRQHARFITYEDISESILAGHKIIINASPAGMAPNENSCPNLPYEFLTPAHYLYDLVYKPAKTLFLQKGEERGATIKNGFEMLVIQAEANWKIWNEGRI